MSLRVIVGNVCKRAMSTQCSPAVDLAIDRDGLATITLQRAPANVLTLDVLQDLTASLHKLSKIKPQGLILTSSLPTIFCGGLDVNEMLYSDRTKLKNYLKTAFDAWLSLLDTEYTTTAAINGHSPAGGCIMSMCCDLRVMRSGAYSIGLNEAALDLPIRPWLRDLALSIMHSRQAELALLRGRMFNPEEALKVRLIDELATDKTDAVNKCKHHIEKLHKLPAHARALTKKNFKGGLVNSLRENQDSFISTDLDYMLKPETRRSLISFMENLKKKT